jgi:hypothetical protein
MKVRPGRVPRRSHQSNQLTLRDLLARRHPDAGQVPVAGFEAVSVLNDHQQAVSVRPARPGNPSRQRRGDGRAERRGQVDARMGSDAAVCGRSRDAEGASQCCASDRCNCRQRKAGHGRTWRRCCRKGNNRGGTRDLVAGGKHPPARPVGCCARGNGTYSAPGIRDWCRHLTVDPDGPKSRPPGSLVPVHLHQQEPACRQPPARRSPNRPSACRPTTSPCGSACAPSPGSSYHLRYRSQSSSGICFRTFVPSRSSEITRHGQSSYPSSLGVSSARGGRLALGVTIICSRLCEKRTAPGRSRRWREHRRAKRSR